MSTLGGYLQFEMCEKWLLIKSNHKPYVFFFVSVKDLNREKEEYLAME